MEKQYLIKYKCYNCDHEWHEVYSCACDSECENCDARNVTALEWIELESNLLKEEV